jgi:hypothetical protein
VSFPLTQDLIFHPNLSLVELTNKVVFYRKMIRKGNSFAYKCLARDSMVVKIDSWIPLPDNFLVVYSVRAQPSFLLCFLELMMYENSKKIKNGTNGEICPCNGFSFAEMGYD